MTIHQRSAFDFRVQEWPKTSSSSTLFFQKARYRINAVPLLNYVLDVMVRVGRARTRKSTFTLLNVYHELSMLSCGKEPQPHRTVRPGNVLAFTFAFAFRPYTQARPISNQPLEGYRLWSANYNAAATHMTINVPRSVMREMGVTTFNLREMEWLYMLVGAFTKAYLRKPEWFISHYDNYLTSNVRPPETLLRSSVYNLFTLYTYPEWIYSAWAWENMANTLNPRAVDQRFALHFAKYLTRYWNRELIPNVLEVQNAIWEELRGFVLDCQQRNDMLPLQRMIPGITEVSSVEAVVQQLVTGGRDG